MKKRFFVCCLCLLGLLFSVVCATNREKLIASWSFEDLYPLRNDSINSLSAIDDTGNGNSLVIGKNIKVADIISDEVPYSTVNERNNAASLRLKRSEYIVPFDKYLPFCDMQYGWNINLSVKCNLLGTEQVFICKEGLRGSLNGDISIGFDPMECKYFVEVSADNGNVYRLAAGDLVKAGEWYDVYAEAVYDKKKKCSVLTFGVKNSGANKYKVSSVKYDGMAVRHNAGRWIIGHGFPGGFPNSLSVLDGNVDEISIYGIERDYIPGQNPLFRDAFTADPAVMVYQDTVYAYVGLDKAGIGGWFNMPGWLCYTSTDMKNWTSHGIVLKASDFPNSNPYGAWAAQVVEKNGKFYFYVTLDRSDNGEHKIDVAVGDSPLGPFKPARKDGTPLITDDMTLDSHRWNADIDPTVLIDDDGTSWMAWGNGDCYMVKLKDNMIELDGEVKKVPYRNFSEGPWLFKRGNLYYNVYAADAPGVQPEQICYSTAENINGPWTYRGFITGPTNFGFTIHPSVIEFKNQWYFFYHDGSYPLNGEPGGDCRRHVCVEYLNFNEDGTIKPIKLTSEGISNE